MNKEIMDGNTACSLVSYNFIDAAAIYPITPSSTMAELIDSYSASGKLNMFNDKVKVIEMQSEAGAIGAVHGMLQNGILSATFTASQGLLLMIPNMYKIAGELLPCVINVAARTVATHALSIMGDHSDVNACLQTGFALFASSNPQQVMDLSCIPYLASLEGKVPFINFFDGFRTSHEMDKVRVVDKEIYKDMINKKALEEFRARSLNIDNPKTIGTNEGDNIYFQNFEARSKYYIKLPDIVNKYMEMLNKKIGTSYKPFNYYGKKNAKNIIVAMGSVTNTIKEFIDKKDNYGLIEVHLYKPFSKKYFLDVFPKTVKKAAVLDRSKTHGSKSPLYLDVLDTIKEVKKDIKVVGGVYGLSSKDVTLNDIEAVYNMLDSKSVNDFTIGIIDDVTNMSLTPTKTIFKKTADEILIYGYGSDGMVSASKDILKIVGKTTPKYVQGYFYYDSKKSGGVTKCHLRFSMDEIKSTYYIKNPKIVVLTKDTYLKKYNILKEMMPNGVFILNTEKNKNELGTILTKEDILSIKEKNIDLYIINASKIASDNNIPNKISTIMETALLNITNLVNKDSLYEKIINRIKENYQKKGQDIVSYNIKAMYDTIDNIEKININTLNSNIKKEESVNTIFSKLDHLEGDTLKVSDFTNYEDGMFDAGTSSYEKRGISNITPSWDKDKCIMCNMCSFVCPHAVIRCYLLDKEEVLKAPKYIKDTLKDANIKGQDLKYAWCMSPLDCTGCSLCEGVCPVKAIKMQNIKLEEQKKFDYLEKNIKEKQILPKETVKGVGFCKPKFMFSGACRGCGETPYLNLLTKLFKDNIIIANATGCSSIYGASLPSTPYSVPWGNSLFEDNAEFGLGIRTAEDVMHDRIINIMKENKNKLNNHNKRLVNKYLKEYSKEVSFEVYEKLDYDNFKEIIPYKKYIKEKSIWCVGGDGWAYDIGYGGIDHVLASGMDINILVLDTESYSNTGGQASKATRNGAIAKFAASGKKTDKKDLGRIAMCYENVYVATVSLGGGYNQVIKALKEANDYKGPSIVICYAPCIAHGIKNGMKDSIKEEKLAVDSGYFPLYRYNPETKKLTLDSKIDSSKIDEIFERENRYKMCPDKTLLERNKENAKETYEKLQEEAEKDVNL